MLSENDKNSIEFLFFSFLNPMPGPVGARHPGCFGFPPLIQSHYSGEKRSTKGLRAGFDDRLGGGGSGPPLQKVEGSGMGDPHLYRAVSSHSLPLKKNFL